MIYFEIWIFGFLVSLCIVAYFERADSFWTNLVEDYKREASKHPENPNPNISDRNIRIMVHIGIFFICVIWPLTLFILLVRLIIGAEQ